MNNVLDNIKQFLNKYLNSVWSIAVISIVIFSSWLTGYEFVGFTFAVIYMALICLVCDNLGPGIPLIVLTGFAFSATQNLEQHLNDKTYFIIILSVFLIGALAYFFINNVRQNKIKLTFGRQFWWVLSLFLAVLLGGILYDFNQWASGIPIILVLGAAGFGAYLVVVNGCPKINKNFLAGTFVAAGIMICAQVFTFYARNLELFKILDFELFKGLMNFGWGVSNNAASILLITIPMTAYLMLKSKTLTVISPVLILIQIVAMLLTMSRGVLLIFVVGFPVIFVFTLIKTKNKIYFLIGIVGAVIAGVIIYFAFNEIILKIIERALVRGLDDAGRNDLIIIAIEKWLINAATIIMGTGIMEGFATGGHYSLFLYHCTPVQMLSSSGIIGLIAYLGYSYSKFRVLIERSDIINKFILFAVIMWTGYSFADQSSFMFNQLMMLAMLLVAAEKILIPKVQESDSSALTQSQSLPLT